jgi:hypothetical protein
MGAIQQALLADVGGAAGTQTPYGAAVTLNALNMGSNISLSNGGLTAAMTSSGFSGGNLVFSTAAAPSGTSIAEMTVTTNATPYNDFFLGVATSAASLTNYPGGDAHADGIIGGSASVYNNGSVVQTNGADFAAATNIVGWRYVTSTGVFKFYLNGVAINSYTTGLGASVYLVVGIQNNGTFSTTITMNFGATAFTYTYS